MNKKGKFGSGFLTIHLVSHKVRVKGILQENGERKGFEFFLDRSGSTSKEIQQNMEIAWADFMQALCDLSGDQEFTTGFECELDGDAAVVVESGLSDLERAAPYVLAFVDELDEVTVSRPGKAMSWRRLSQEHSGEVTATQVVCERSGEVSRTVRVVAVGDCANRI